MQLCNCFCFILLLLCGDIETNPGPIDQCPICETKVLDNHYAVLCDGCICWYHINCINMTKKEYERLARMDSFTWQCKDCIRNETFTVCKYRKRKQLVLLPSKQLQVPESKKQNILQEHSYAVYQPQVQTTENNSLTIER